MMRGRVIPPRPPLQAMEETLGRRAQPERTPTLQNLRFDPIGGV